MKACIHVRWSREDHCLCVQWVDNKVVTLLSNFTLLNLLYSQMKNRGKITVKIPYVIERYNVHMKAVDKVDQMLLKHNLLVNVLDGGR